MITPRPLSIPKAAALALLIGAGNFSSLARGADSTTSALKDLSLDQLMDVEVTSVSRHPESLLRSASAIQVIAREDIRRSGATSIPEALRLADNLDVAQKNSHDWAISARGFNTALANKLLVMIDGRTVYTPLFSGVFWDVQDYLLEDIDRIEVISGPGGTLWGTNAVNGVINIITRKASDTQGLYVEGGGGNQLQEFAAGRYGGQLGDATQFRFYGKYFDRGDESISDGSPAQDSWHQAQGGFRLDSALSSQDELSVHGDFYGGHENEEANNLARTAGGNIVGQWNHEFGSGSQMTLQSYYDRTHLADPIPVGTIANVPVAPAGYLFDDLTTLDLDFQYQFQAGSHHLVWGWGYRHTHDSVQNAPALGFFPATLNRELYSAFLQDEVALSPALSLTLGSKVEHNDYTGFEYEPNLRMQWSMTPGQSLWGAVSRAVRSPSRVDVDLKEAAPPFLVFLQGASDFRSEEVLAYELGYHAQLTARTAISLSTYFNDYEDVRSTSFTPATIIPLYFQNNLEGHTYGAEWSSSFQVLDNWSLHLGYTLLQERLHVKPGAFDLDAGLNETADPQQQVSLRSSATLFGRLEVDASLKWVDSLRINSGPTAGLVPSYFALDTRMAWRIAPNLELSLVGQNLLQPRHVEYGFPSPLREQIDRSAYAKISWRY